MEGLLNCVGEISCSLFLSVSSSILEVFSLWAISWWAKRSLAFCHTPLRCHASLVLDTTAPHRPLACLCSVWARSIEAFYPDAKGYILLGWDALAASDTHKMINDSSVNTTTSAGSQICKRLGLVLNLITVCYQFTDWPLEFSIESKTES